MDYGHHHTHHRRDESPPPPPRHHHEPPPPPHLHHEPPPPQHLHHNYGGPSPPPPSYHHHQPGFAPPAPASVHVTHIDVVPESEAHRHHPHGPSASHHIPHPDLGELAHKPTVKVFCKADPNFHLTIRDGKVVLAPADPADPFQHWYKDEKFSTRVKDSVGFPSFSLVNKATGQAIKHAIGGSHPVQLTMYKANHLDESILWSESKDTGEGYRSIRMINNIKLNVDAFKDGNKHAVHNGTVVGLWEWKNGDNQRWKIVPY